MSHEGNGRAGHKDQPSVDRMPPHNIEAEMGVLGSVLLDPDMLAEVIELLPEPEAFFRATHQNVYRAILNLSDRSEPIDPLTVAEELTRLGAWKEIGDTGLGEILGSVPHAVNARYYAHIVAMKATARDLGIAADETITEVHSNEHTSDELVARTEERVNRIASRSVGSSVVMIGNAVADVLDRIELRKTASAGLSSGLPDLDAITDGFQDDQLIILAARPSMGKTALALNLVEHCTLNLSRAALFVSLEMNRIELAERVLVSRSGVDASLLKQSDRMTAADMEAIARAYAELQSAPLSIDDSPARTMAQVASVARRWKTRHNIALLIVDYIQLVTATNLEIRSSRQEQVAGISRRLKTLARELHVPVLALSQLNRQPEGREDRRPRMSDLRESGAIEQDADVVLLLHRPDYYDSTDRPGVAELIVAKNRNGATRSVPLAFAARTMRFDTAPPDVDFGPADYPAAEETIRATRAEF
jgi:replicative DNA helicase